MFRDHEEERFLSIMQMGTVCSFLISGRSTLLIKNISRLVLRVSKSLITVLVSFYSNTG